MDYHPRDSKCYCDTDGEEHILVMFEDGMVFHLGDLADVVKS